MAAPDPAPQLSKDSSCTGGGVHTWQHPIPRRSCQKILLAPEGASTQALQEAVDGRSALSAFGPDSPDGPACRLLGVPNLGATSTPCVSRCSSITTGAVGESNTHPLPTSKPLNFFNKQRQRVNPESIHLGNPS